MTTRLGWLFQPVSDRGHDNEKVLSVYRDHGVIPKDSRTDNFNRTPENLGNYQLVQPGDLVVNRMKAWQGSLGISEHQGIVSPDYEVLRPVVPTYDRRFVHSLLRSRALIDQYALRSTGIRPSQWRLYWDEMKTIEVSLPATEEQRAIADYLDRETARIDTLIEEQQRLIELFRERRRAVALHAINQPISSGAATDKLGRSAHIGNGSTPSRESTAYWDGGNIPWLNSSVVNEPRVTYAEQFVTDEALRECHLPLVPPGSVLVGLTGQGKTRGTATILDIKATVNQHIAYVTPDRSKWLPEYLLWLLRASYDELRRLSEENGSTKGGLTCEAIKRFRLAAPSLDKQRQIAAFLDQQTAKIDIMIAEAERFIELARERRAALITAAVTGQIDVREMA
ncbi:restriction endonuclease subunit S [Solwaraspora sp. WMMB762]|uniref:restriction endonuclease subunit S n=1 Tax=Solwaraspora sp. WMMB762 TaxID=3404120 RepID=UPI003B946C9B